ncbi:hypothetical protein TcasGA2_TC002167 [Tribolium castaneum]|uniref:Helitron helicase-like domain-containing protein n=1 Tax=Tribolium castaneum TaxID=7070 RepID=D7GXR4_TRICA|nr:hypothetical protein TcasGA2_TC002167 [Tribolium castaneum]
MRPIGIRLASIGIGLIWSGTWLRLRLLVGVRRLRIYNLPARGVWSAELVGSLRELGLCARHFNHYTTMALCSSWRNWVRFNASTASRIGRGRGNASSRSGKLLQQYTVDAWVRTDSDYFMVDKAKPKTTRVAEYTAIRRYLENRAVRENARIGKITISPSTSVNSPREK